MLTPRQERFVQEYLIDLNATQAAIRAGYSDKGATVRGSELLANRNVAAALAERQRQREERTAVTQDWALRRLVAEAEYTGDGSSHSARVSALGLAMKHLGMLKEDAPHPDRKPLDLSKVPDDLKRLILAGIRTARGSTGGG
ncbi:MAG TPA: terminase small subunit [Gemmata sp.]|jgi:hypothetical protein|nr:terminase small subunit [Gemmata sp.]